MDETTPTKTNWSKDYRAVGITVKTAVGKKRVNGRLLDPSQSFVREEAIREDVPIGLKVYCSIEKPSGVHAVAWTRRYEFGKCV